MTLVSSRIQSNSADFIICRFSYYYSKALIHSLDGKRSTRKGLDRSKILIKMFSSKNTRQYENNKKLMKYKGREGWERAWNFKCMQRSVNLYVEKWGIIRFPSLLFNLCTPIFHISIAAFHPKTVSLVLHKPLSNPVFLLLVHLTSLILLKKRYVFSI